MGIKNFCYSKVRKNLLYRFFVLCILTSNSLNCVAQEIKKSTKKEVVEDKMFILHTVENGQTLFSIAKAYEVSKNDIVLENPDLINGLKNNIIIRIPVDKKNESIAKKQSSESEHKVEAGQTLYAISKKYGTTVEAILNLNPEVKQNGLKFGEVIKIPTTQTYAEPKKENIAKVITTPTEKIKTSSAIIESKKSDPTIVEEKTTIDNAYNKVTVSSSVVENPLLYQKQINKEPASLPLVPGEIKVAFLAPFYAPFNNLSDSGLIHELYSKSNIALEFYQGFKLAADSLANQGYTIKLMVEDTENDSVILAALLKKTELKQVNLIIGPFFEKEIHQTTNELKKSQTPIVSPFSQSNKPLLSNPFLSKCVASQATESRVVANYVAANFKSTNLILVSSDNSKDKSLNEIVKQTLNPLKQKSDTLKNFVHSNGGDFKGLGNLLTKDKPNVIIASLNDQAIVTELFNFIKQQKEISFSIFGCDTWFNYENLDVDALVNNNVYLPTTYYVDYESQLTKNMIKNFKNKYATEPSKYAFHGFDVGMYYLKLAQNKQVPINFLDEYKGDGIQTRFNFFQSAIDSGWENQNVFIMKYDNYKLVKVN